MKLLFLFGNTAVGKMTVGQELTKITPFRLFHNHMMIEPVLEIFDDFNVDAFFSLRDVLFEKFAKTNHYGMIFTFMWAFDHPEDWDYVAHIKQIFNLPDEDIYYVELLASQKIRLERNISENRLANKASKRDIAASNQRLLNDDRRYRCESLPGEITFPNYLRLENENITAQEAAQIIRDRFRFPSR